MLGLMGTLDLAARAMQAQMTGVEVTGQNLANVNTKGYSRQVVNLATSADLATGKLIEGTGVSVVGIQQMVSSLLNKQIQSQSSTSGYWNAQQSALQDVQNSLNEFLSSSSSTSSTSSSTTIAAGSGLSGQLASFFSAFSALTASPSDSNKQAVMSAASTLATTFNHVSNQLSASSGALDAALDSQVASANQLLTQIASLNQQIVSGEASGGNANNLRDARQQALENLAQLTNITTTNNTNGSVDVAVGSQTLVSGFNVADTLATYSSSSGQKLVQTTTGAVSLAQVGGAMQGTMDVRDGELATMLNGIQNLASNLITQVNTIHGTGFNASGGTGNLFFTGNNAGSITVNSALANNPALLQISVSATQGGDTSLAAQIAGLATTTQAVLNNQTFGDSYLATVSGFGLALNNADTEATNQTAVNQLLSTQRGSVSGVNVDEEMTNMMTYQRAYEACAQVVSTINSLMATTLAMKQG